MCIVGFQDEHGIVVPKMTDVAARFIAEHRVSEGIVRDALAQAYLAIPTARADFSGIIQRKVPEYKNGICERLEVVHAYIRILKNANIFEKYVSGFRGFWVNPERNFIQQIQNSISTTDFPDAPFASIHAEWTDEQKDHVRCSLLAFFEAKEKTLRESIETFHIFSQMVQDIDLISKTHTNQESIRKSRIGNIWQDAVQVMKTMLRTRYVPQAQEYMCKSPEPPTQEELAFLRTFAGDEPEPEHVPEIANTEQDCTDSDMDDMIVNAF